MAESDLPLSLFVRMASPEAVEEEEMAELNMTINKQCPSLLSLFEDVVEGLQARAICTEKNKLVVVYHNQTPAVLSLSDDGMTLQLRAAHFAAIWFVLKELTQRLFNVFDSLGGKCPMLRL